MSNRWNARPLLQISFVIKIVTLSLAVSANPGGEKSPTHHKFTSVEEAQAALEASWVDNIEDAQVTLIGDPIFKHGVNDRLFDFLDPVVFVNQLQESVSGIPRNDGRFEYLDRNGLALASAYQSPAEEESLGYNTVNRLKEPMRQWEISVEELKVLESQGDPAAIMEFARLAIADHDVKTAEPLIVRAATITNRPAPFSSAAMAVYPESKEEFISRAAWFLTAYAMGDSTIATLVRSSLATMPKNAQGVAIDNAERLLEELNVRNVLAAQ